MSISVTVSGEDSTSVILSSVLTELVSISGGSSVDVVASSGNSAIITVSSGDPISITGNYSNFVTGQVVRPPEIADFLTENQINTKITTATGDYNTLAANTFYLDSNPSGFITGVDLSSYVQDSETGLFLVSGEDASISALQVGSTPVFPYTRTVKLHDDGVQFGARLALIGTTDNGFPGIEMVTDGDASKRTLIRHEGEGSNDYGISFFTTSNGVVAEKVRFDGDGNVGIGTTTPAAKLHIAGAAQNSYIEPRVENTAAAGAAGFAFINSNQEWKMGVNTADTFRIRDHGASTNPFVIEAGGAPDDSFHMDSNGNVGIGTASPDELLHLEAAAIAGREVLMKATVSDAGNDHFGISNGTSTNNNFAPSFYGYKDSTYGNGYIYSLNFRGLVPDAQDTTQTNRFGIVHFEAFKTNNAADPNNGTINSLTNRKLFTFSNGGNTVLEIDADNTVTISQDLSVSGDSSFSNRPTVNGTGVLLSGEGGGGTVENVVHTTGDQTISGTKSFGKISLSENSFVTETGSFTIGSTHRGATVLLENSAPMTVTIPAQVSGHTTTFIAETSNSVVFATGAGISGFNSFNSANQIAGIYGQAQIIFKSPEYAFLGGNVV